MNNHFLRKIYTTIEITQTEASLMYLKEDFAYSVGDYLLLRWTRRLL